MPPDIPLATYRLQLTKDFGFDDAAKIVPYLKALGVTHVYSSPFLTARPGSTHGYDVVDHNALNPELGGEEAFARLDAALKDAGLGLILDFVPNHMAVGSGNAWWVDVLEWGQRSRHAASFDISWELLPYRPGGGVLLPVLGKPYGDALTSGEIELKYDAKEGSFSVWYYDQRFPINPQRYSDILKTVVGAAGAADEPAGQALLAVANDYARFGTPSYAQAPALKVRLARDRGRGRGHRARAVGLSRRPRGRRQCAASAAGAAALSPRRLASLGIQHQLPALFRYQRTGRPARRGCAHLPRNAQTGGAPCRQRPIARHTPRPHRRAARSRAIHTSAAATDPRSARRRTRQDLLYAGRENPRRGRGDAAVAGGGRNDRLRMAQCDLARAGRSGRARQTRRVVARDRSAARRFRSRAGKRQAPRARNRHGQRIQRAGATAEPHRRRALHHARLCDRPPARGAAALCSRIPALPHLRDGGGRERRRPRHHRAHHRGGAPALAGHRCRHLQFPPRRAHARSDRRRAALQPAAGAEVRAEDAAVHRADGGEIAGGHRVLSLSRAARPERSRRRADIAGAERRGISRPAWRGARRASRME